MTSATMHSVRVSETIHANADALFSAWTDPEQLKHWWRMEEPGWAFDGASIDLRVGGAYRLGMKSPDGKSHVAVGVYREIDRPKRLAFTWEWEDPASNVGETLVTVEFHDAGEGSTRVVLTHDRFADQARASNHERGWTQLLRLLNRAVGRP